MISMQRCVPAARLSDTASLLVEVNVAADDWLANFRVAPELQESYEVVKLAFEIWIRIFL